MSDQSSEGSSTIAVPAKPRFYWLAEIQGITDQDFKTRFDDLKKTARTNGIRENLIWAGLVVLFVIFLVPPELVGIGIPLIIGFPFVLVVSIVGLALLLRAVPRVNLSVEEEAFRRFYPAYSKLQKYQRKPDTSIWSGINKSLAAGARYVSDHWKAEYLDIANETLEPALGPVREKIGNRFRYGVHSMKPEDVALTLGVLKSVLQYGYGPKGLDHLKMLDQDVEKLPIATGQASSYWRSRYVAFALPIIPAVLLFGSVIAFGPGFGGDRNTNFSVAVLGSVGLYGTLANLLRRKS